MSAPTYITISLQQMVIHSYLAEQTLLLRVFFNRERNKPPSRAVQSRTRQTFITELWKTHNARAATAKYGNNKVEE